MKDLKYGYNAAEYKKFKFNAWLYLLLFSLLYCAHYCSRLNISNVTTFSEAELGILSSVLFWTYGIGHLVNGRLGEIVGIRRFIILSVLLSIIANIVMGISLGSSIVVMAIIWGFNGFFQSMAWSPGVSSLTAWWPGDKRGFATGFANAFSGFGEVGAKLMVVLGFVLFPTLGARSAFFVPIAFPALMLIIYIIFAKAGPKSVGLKDYEEEDADKAEKENEMAAIVKEKGVLYPYLHLLKNKLFLVWVFVVFASGLARYGLATWIPKYLTTMGMKDTSSILTSIVLPIGMGIGTFIIPTLTDKYCPNNRLLAAVVSGIGAAACVVGFMFLKPEGFQLILMMVLLFFAGFFIYAINGVVWTFAADVGGRVFSSTAAGVLDFAAYMGAAIQATVFGFILGDGNWNILFISVAAFCFLIALVSALSSKKKTA